jgi:flagellum-specific peptidoglycan hydrolase FlgJ
MMPVQPARKPRPWWQQATALVTVSTGGVITGLNFAPGAPGTMTSPNGLPVHLLAMQQSASGTLGADGSALAAGGAQSGDSALRPAIVNIARHYLHLAQTKSPAEMEALIWAADSVDGVDHGQSCAAFASLTLELAAQAVGQESWVAGGATYPWPLHSWADVRVDANPDSLNIISIVQDAQAHSRWHPVSDGYTPLPGDWVLFHQHVEVVTGYANGVLRTIGGDSLPNFTVNAHTFTGPLADAGVEGFVDNGNLAAATARAAPGNPGPANEAPGRPPASTPPASAQPARGPQSSAQPAAPAPAKPAPARAAAPARGSVQAAADIPGLPPASSAPSTPPASNPPASATSTQQAAPTPKAASKPARVPAAGKVAARPGTSAPAGRADIPGLPATSAPTMNVPATSAPRASAPPAGKGALAAIPGVSAVASPARGTPAAAPGKPRSQGRASSPSTPGAPAHASPAPTPTQASPAPTPAHATPAAPYHKPAPARSSHAPSSQQSFINAVAPGAMAAQQRWGVPASVTISQAIEESAWGQSSLSANYNNLFGIKGTGPGGSVMLPTQEFQGGQWVTVDAPFRVYHNIAESISDHAQLLATSGYYTHAMADRSSPDAFANDLTGVYATDPHYGGNLISIMRLYNLYRYDAGSAPHVPAHPATPPPTHTAAPSQSPYPPGTPQPSGAPQPSGTAQPSTSAPASSPAPGATPAPSSPASAPSASPSPSARPSQYAQPSHPAPPASAAPGYASGHPHAHAAADIPGQQPFAPAGHPAAAGGAAIPGLAGYRGGGAAPRYGAPASPRAASAVTTATTMAYVRAAHAAPRVPARPAQRLYEPELPDAVQTAFFATARTPIARAAPMYKDIATQAGLSWKLLAACDWMQCQAQPHLSPVHGERLGSLNPDGTVYTTRSAALAQCAADLIELAFAVYRIDLTVPQRMSVQSLADVFAAFRWGGLLRRHRVSSMEFPYSVEGLTKGHQKMRWPAITDPGAPDKPGTRFRGPFGAVPIVLSLDYRATV